MRVLGVDPGLKATGYGCVEFLPNQPLRLIEVGAIEPSPKDGLPNRLNKIHQLLGDVIEDHHPEVMVLEKLYAHAQYPTTSSILGHARGVICLVCAQKDLRLVEHSPKRIRKAVTGNGNATKQQTQIMVAHILDINPEPLTLDASDALALAIGYLRMHQQLL